MSSRTAVAVGLRYINATRSSAGGMLSSCSIQNRRTCPTTRTRGQTIILSTARKYVTDQFEHISVIDGYQSSQSVKTRDRVDLGYRRDWMHSRLECFSLVRSA